MMVKVLLLQQWYNLSDHHMEKALNDRISFRRFVGLGLQDATSDHSTISRFRSALGEETSAQLFRELSRQMEEQGMVLKQGTLLDATIVESQVRRPSLQEGRGARSPETRMPTGLPVIGDGGRTSGTRCTWGWMRSRD